MDHINLRDDSSPFGGPPTFNAEFDQLQALTHDAHTAKTIARGEKHYYTDPDRPVGGTSARAAQEVAKILREVEELARQVAN